MKKLDAVVRKHGLTHAQVKENEAGYLYEVFSQERSAGFDVFERKTSKDREATIKGVKIRFRAAEQYPNDSAFGVWAWHYVTIEQATAKFNSLVA